MFTQIHKQWRARVLQSATPSLDKILAKSDLLRFEKNTENVEKSKKL